MDIDNVTYIIYDKYAQESHSFNNKQTININIDKLFKSDATVLDGQLAIDEFNKYALKTHKIKSKIDTDFYKIHLFSFTENDIIKKVLILGSLQTNFATLP